MSLLSAYKVLQGVAGAGVRTLFSFYDCGAVVCQNMGVAMFMGWSTFTAKMVSEAYILCTSLRLEVGTTDVY